MGYKFTSIHCNCVSLTTVHEPEDQGVSIVSCPLFSSRHVSETHSCLTKLLSASLVRTSRYPQLSQRPQCRTEKPRPVASLEGFHTASAGAATTQSISPYFNPRRLSGHADLAPRWQHGARWVRRQHGWRTLTPGHPAPWRTLSAEGSAALGEPGKNSRVCLRPKRRHATQPTVCLQALEEGLL